MSVIESMTSDVMKKKPNLNRDEVRNQIRDAVLAITDSLHHNFHDNMSAEEFCNIHEKWAKTAASKMKIGCGFTVSMSEYFAYAWRVEETSQ